LKAATVEALREVHESSKALKKALGGLKGSHLSGARLAQCQELSGSWFDDARPKALSLGLEVSVLESYDQRFARLLSLTGGTTARRQSVEKVLSAVNRSFKKDLIVPAQTHIAGSKTPPTDFAPLLERLPNAHENAYVAEGLACLSDGHLKASVVIGWCAAIDRIHRRIEEMGFDTFSDATREMASASSGRFKRFNKKYTVTSISELRQVFDKDILLVLEYLRFLDFNQQVRLRGCCEMRDHAAHPGDAPITRLNVLSFYSDVVEIVLANTAFAVSGEEDPA